MRERAQVYLDDPTLVKNIVTDGCEKAKKLAEETMRERSLLDTISLNVPPANGLFNKEYVVVLSEWTDDNPIQVQRISS